MWHRRRSGRYEIYDHLDGEKTQVGYVDARTGELHHLDSRVTRDALEAEALAPQAELALQTLTNHADTITAIGDAIGSGHIDPADLPYPLRTDETHGLTQEQIRALRLQRLETLARLLASSAARIQDVAAARRNEIEARIGWSAASASDSGADASAGKEGQGPSQLTG